MTRIDMAPATSSSGPCLHAEQCPKWRTRDDRTYYVCRLSERHLQNIVNTALRNNGIIPDIIANEYERREFMKKDVPRTTDVVYGYKCLIASKDGMLFSPREFRDPPDTQLDWLYTTKKSWCMTQHKFMDESHFRVHRGATGCGLYFFEDVWDADKFRSQHPLVSRHRILGAANLVVVVQCVLFGRVVSVDFSEFEHSEEKAGFLAEKARVEQVWSDRRRYEIETYARHLDKNIRVNPLRDLQFIRSN